MFIRAIIVAAALLFPVSMEAPSRPLEASLSDYSCLGKALYMESRGEGLKGSRAVLDVIHARMEHKQQNACDVIYSKGQFQWTKKPHDVPEHKWEQLYGSVMSSPKVLDSSYKWFYNPSLSSPAWAKKMKCKKINRHKFCKEMQNVH